MLFFFFFSSVFLGRHYRSCVHPDPHDDSGASDLDVEAAAADDSFGEGKFYIDPDGDGSFTAATARCFKAVIHRCGIWFKKQASELRTWGIPV